MLATVFQNSITAKDIVRVTKGTHAVRDKDTSDYLQPIPSTSTATTVDSALLVHFRLRVFWPN